MICCVDRSKIGQLFDTAINPRVVRRYHFDSESDGEDGEADVVDRIDDGEEGDEGGDDGLDEEQFYTTSGFSGEEVTV